MLTGPTNGMINCSLGVNGIPNPGETCTVTCNTGDTRTCQNDGSWSGSDVICSSGEYLFIYLMYSYVTTWYVMIFIYKMRYAFFLLVTCPSLTNFCNGMITSSLKSDRIFSPVEACTFACDSSYMWANY